MENEESVGLSAAEGQTVVADLTMSRGDIPDCHVDFAKIETLHVLDADGDKIRVGDIYKSQKTILILVRVRILWCVQFKKNRQFYKTRYFLQK